MSRSGPSARAIRSLGQSYTVRNASGGGGRDVPQYADDGTLIAVLERRGLPRTVTDSGGEEVETDLEVRAVPNAATLREAGSADGYPTKLVHPDGRAFRVLNIHEEDGGVAVLTVTRE